MADTQHTRISGKAQSDTTYADNTNGDINAADMRQSDRNIYESSAILASENIFSESNVLGEVDHTQAVGTTALDAYSNTNENAPGLHVYSNTANPYAIAIENSNNTDADTKRFILDQLTAGDFALIRVSESGGTDTGNTVFTVDQNDRISINKLLNLKDSGELTIASGAITITGSRHSIDTESDAATDDLDTINGGSDGDIFIGYANNTTRSVVFKDGTGNLQLEGDFTCNNAADRILLMSDGTTWFEISRSNNAS